MNLKRFTKLNRHYLMWVGVLIGMLTACSKDSPVTPPSVAALSELTLSNGFLSPTFSSNTINYKVAVDNNVSSITITPGTSNASVIVKVNGTQQDSGKPSNAIPLNVGDNTVTIEATVKDGTAKRTYTLVISRASGNEVTLKGSAPFPWGAAVNVSLMKSSSTYFALVEREMSSVTAENEMKMSRIKSSQNSWNFSDADYLVNFAAQRNMRVHGHTLIWHRAPAWLNTFNGDAAAWEALFKDYIQTVVTRYKGKITSWDVVNEAFNDDGTYRNINTSDPSKGSIWYQKLGPDYIARAFQYAHEADPNALLFYNDYGHEYSADKRTAIANLIANLKSRGVPIHGIGLQMHITKNITNTQISAAINMAVATGLKVHIAELDVAMNPSGVQTMTFTPTVAQEQAAIYKQVVKTYLAIPEAQKFGITTWNLTDGDSWIPGTYNRPDWPLPFDESYNRKAAYQGILDGFK